MDSQPSAPATNTAPPAEVLRPRTADSRPAPIPAPAGLKKKLLGRSYRPSHKATLLAIAAVMVILGINAAIIGLVLHKQAQKDQLAAKSQVTLSTSQLNQLGINRTNLGSSGVKLTVAPDSQFKGNLAVDGNSTFSGSVLLNSKLTGTSASFSQLTGGNTSLAQLNVNGNGTLNTLNLRQDLAVAGQTQLQGPVTLSQLLTVNNSVNIVGDLAVGGTLNVNQLSIKLLAVSGHIITSGTTPGVGRGGSALGSNGTVSISGNDAAGNIGINVGTGAVAGTLVNVAFASLYASIPKVVITPIGIGADFYITNLTNGGFSVAVASALPPGGYHIDYIVEQ